VLHGTCGGFLLGLLRKLVGVHGECNVPVRALDLGEGGGGGGCPIQHPPQIENKTKTTQLQEEVIGIHIKSLTVGLPV
jgi:hypothetical protein